METIHKKRPISRLRTRWKYAVDKYINMLERNVSVDNNIVDLSVDKRTVKLRRRRKVVDISLKKKLFNQTSMHV